MPKTSFVKEEPFESYRDRFAEHFVMSRENGIIEVRMHTGGEEAMWSLELHRAIGQLFEVIGADRENELLIYTGTGDYWLRSHDVDSFADERDQERFKRTIYETWYRDGLRLQENLIWDIDIPSIAIVNGPGFHTEFALLADLTICADDAKFIEPHLLRGLAPGDAQFLVFQQLLGLKRANYAMYLAEAIDAQQALEWGLVNEVLSRDQLLPRARELAARIMQNDPVLRRITNHIVKRPWRRLLTDDFEMHFAHEMWGAMISRIPHDGSGIPDALGVPSRAEEPPAQ